jgi:cell division septum initiation protein DivIVA
VTTVQAMLAQIEKLQAENADLRRQLEEARGQQETCTGAEFVEAAQAAMQPRSDEEIMEAIEQADGEEAQRTACKAWENLFNERNRLWREAEAKLEKVRELLEANGCDCDCDHGCHDHEPDCERCLACRIAWAVKR